MHRKTSRALCSSRAPNEALAHPVRCVRICVLTAAITEVHSCRPRPDSPSCQGTPLSRGSIETNEQRTGFVPPESSAYTGSMFEDVNVKARGVTAFQLAP